MPWDAKWISYGQHPKDDLGVFEFRRVITLETAPASCLVRVSADQRYELVVNGVRIGDGPSRGDFEHWTFEEYEIADALRPGQNNIVAKVWSFGRYAPAAQLSERLAFVLDGPGLSTPEEWTVSRIENHEFEMMNDGVGPFYIDVGPGEVIGPSLPRSWVTPNVIGPALERGEWDGNSAWWLVPRSIPAMVRRSVEPAVRRWVGPAGARLPDPITAAFEVRPGAPVLLDHGALTTGYLGLRLAGTPGAEVTLTYAEAVTRDGMKVLDGDPQRANVRGIVDRFNLGPDGGMSGSPVWWRTWRYLEFSTTAPVMVESLTLEETGYPYLVESSFVCDEDWVDELWDVGIRTLQRCAGETYFDCPYYEQLQYVGDTRLQALCHAYLSRDRRLARQAIEQFAWSLRSDGLIASCYPARIRQVIPGFALWWVVMLADRLMLDPDPPHEDLKAAASRILAGVDALTDVSYWPFMDWVTDWPVGVPSGGVHSPEHRLLVELARDADARLRGMTPLATDPGFADAPSEHSRALRALVRRGRGLPEEPWRAGGHPAASLYFSYYSHYAERAEDYLGQLGPWREMLRRGSSTFAETAGQSRSECHAWSAHPVLGLLQQVAGVESTAPGWARARIAPRPGSLSRFRAVVAHPLGDLEVEFGSGGLRIVSPVPFQLLWNGRSGELPPGEHRV